MNLVFHISEDSSEIETVKAHPFRHLNTYLIYVTVDKVLV